MVSIKLYIWYLWSGSAIDSGDLKKGNIVWL